MPVKVESLCRDNTLAAALVLDLASARADMSGIQEWLSFYYKSPMMAEGLYPEHVFFNRRNHACG